MMWFQAGSDKPVFYSGGGMDGKPHWLVHWVMQRIRKAETTGNRLSEVEHLLSQLYHWFDGYDCTPKETKQLDNSVENLGWAHRLLRGAESSVYGEVLPEGVLTVLDTLDEASLLSETDVFYDFGSGTGKIAIQAALMSPCQRVVGIELSDTRHGHAVRAMEEAEELELEKGGSALQGELIGELKGAIASGSLSLVQGDISVNTYEDATHVFAASTTWPDGLMQAIVQNLNGLPRIKTFSTLRDVSDRELEAYPKMRLWKKLKVDVSWTDSADMHVYRFDANKKSKVKK